MDSQYTERYYRMKKRLGYRRGDKPSPDLEHIAAPGATMTNFLEHQHSAKESQMASSSALYPNARPVTRFSHMRQSVTVPDGRVGRIESIQTTDSKVIFGIAVGIEVVRVEVETDTPQ